MIEVLWIDDECMTNSGKLSPMGEEFVNYAFEQNIKITPMQTYKDGVGAIRNNPHKWCAVILDIHNQKATSGKASDDFDATRDEIKSIQALNHQEEPYIFILSGNKLYHGEHSTIRKPDYCSKSIYDKNGENYKQLFEDILKIQNISKLYTCQEQYKDVLTIAKNFCGNETWQRLLMVLYKTTINDVKNDPALLKYIDILDITNVVLSIKGCMKDDRNLDFFRSNVLGRRENLNSSLFKDIPLADRLTLYIKNEWLLKEYVRLASFIKIKILKR